MTAKSEYDKKRRKHFEAAGLCITCGNRPKGKTTKTCSQCAARSKAYNEKAQQKCKDLGLCMQCRKRRAKGSLTVCQQCLERTRKAGWKYRRSLRDEVLAAYGGPKCSCCGDSHKEFLTLDHIHGGGTAHRKKVGTGDKIHRWLRDHGYPTGFRVLCFNCNYAIFRYKVCPHKLDNRRRNGSQKEGR